MKHNSVSGTERQQAILRIIASQHRIMVADICTDFGVSEATARRDLDVLANQEQVRRIRGGAISVNHAPPELPIFQRTADQADEKSRIGQAVAGLIKSGETVFLGSGSTVLEVGRALQNHTGLTVISNSLPILNILSGLPELSVIALGGIFRKSELSFIGHITEGALTEVHADKVVIGVHAINLENGLTNDYLPETMTDRAIMKSGREIIVAADHTKIGKVSTAFLASLSVIHTFVTDELAPRDFTAALRAIGIEVITV